MDVFTLNFKCVYEYGEYILLNVYMDDVLIYSERTTWHASPNNNSLGNELAKVLKKMLNSMDFRSSEESIEKADDRPTKRGDCSGFFKKLRRCKFFTK